MKVRRNEVMDKVRQISDKISRSYENDLKTFESLSEKLKNVTAALEKQQNRRDDIEQSKKEDLRQLSQNFVREVAVL